MMDAKPSCPLCYSNLWLSAGKVIICSMKECDFSHGSSLINTLYEYRDNEIVSKKKKMEAQTYIHKKSCDNCGVISELKIRKGITIKNFLANHDCENCGCNIAGITQPKFTIADKLVHTVGCGNPACFCSGDCLKGKSLRND